MVTLTPAYGRDYKSKAAALRDFEGGKDFMFQPHGKYCSIRDFPKGTEVKIRYGKVRKCLVTKIS